MPNESIPEDADEFGEEAEPNRDSILESNMHDSAMGKNSSKDANKNRDGSVSLSPDPTLAPPSGAKLKPAISPSKKGKKKKAGAADPEESAIKVVANRLDPSQITAKLEAPSV
jgi:hypothetical protein